MYCYLFINEQPDEIKGFWELQLMVNYHHFHFPSVILIGLLICGFSNIMIIQIAELKQ